MTQTEFKTQGGGLSQADAILQHLRTKRTWVCMPELARVSGAYAVHSRIADLRKRGHDIEHQGGRIGGRVLSSYRLR